MKSKDWKKDDKRIVFLYTKKGKTLREIGVIVGKSAERVRQILQRNKINGKHSKLKLKQQADKEKRIKAEKRERDKEYKARYGITYNQFKTIPPDTRARIRLLYKHTKRNLLIRGYEVKINLLEYLDIWEKSGKLDKSGNTKGSYMLARKNFDKDLTRANAHVIPVSSRPHWRVRRT